MYIKKMKEIRRGESEIPEGSPVVYVHVRAREPLSVLLCASENAIYKKRKECDSRNLADRPPKSLQNSITEWGTM